MLRLAMLIIAIAGPSVVFAESTQPIRMRVVESVTGQPVAGAKVRYFAMASEGTLTGHGGRTATLFEVLGASDADGNIILPATAFDPRIFGILGLNTNYENAAMSITHRGYAPVELRNTLRIVPNLAEVIAWEHQGRTVQLWPMRNDQPGRGREFIGR